MGRNLISFSVYGSNPLYTVGGLENITEQEEYFPGWICRFYCSSDIPNLSDYLKEQERGRCEIVIVPPSKGSSGMMERFKCIGDPNADYILIRDADQRLNDKDYQSVLMWQKSGLGAMRGYEEWSQSSLVLMGCSIGFRGGLIPNIEDLINSWLWENEGAEIGERKYGDIPKIKIVDRGMSEPKLFYGADQIFLESLWPLIENNCLTFGLHGFAWPDHKPLKWGGNYMYRRIKIGCGCKEIFGDRPSSVYLEEERTADDDRSRS